jgi:hypothetical protein
MKTFFTPPSSAVSRACLVLLALFVIYAFFTYFAVQTEIIAHEIDSAAAFASSVCAKTSFQRLPEFTELCIRKLAESRKWLFPSAVFATLKLALRDLTRLFAVPVQIEVFVYEILHSISMAVHAMGSMTQLGLAVLFLIVPFYMYHLVCGKSRYKKKAYMNSFGLTSGSTVYQLENQQSRQFHDLVQKQPLLLRNIITDKFE